MSSRYHKALVKAEKEHDAALAATKVANDEWIEASQVVEQCRLDFLQNHPDKKWGYFDDPTFKSLRKIAYDRYEQLQEYKSKARKLKEVMDLKDRQLADYLERCPRSCVCVKPDTDAMVQCDGCKNWFHLACVKLTEEEAQALPRFDCLMCVRMQPESQSESPAPSSPPNTPEVEAPHSQSACTLS
jgi:hypothetical protein